ncbi:uncharacterized protein Bfra_008297 [Botrytis fragariae]|uniref:Uncharacterized protein n=1 Tax=Botrytis fragariae TaxID=1964551 RepID=A0A8H6ATC7_9HELO|nr:uncharacterized protein Bfra_008297 [Botrytis fragariae]KAF5873020.1 hypothetical protein Bfra_008297 [Botrytis fragariae]
MQLKLESHGGVVGSDSGLLANVDDRVKSIITKNLLGLASDPTKTIEEYGTEHSFRTYKEGRI